MTDLNHTSQEKYQGVLLEVAREVYELVFGDNRDETLLQRLRDALKDVAAQEKKHREYMKRQAQQAIKAKKSFMVVSSNKQIPDEYKGVVVVLEQIPDEYKSRIVKYFRVDSKLTPPKPPLSGRRCYIDKDGKKKAWTSPVKSRPIDTHYSIALSPSELSKEESEHRDLVALSCIYDNRRTQIGKQDKINDSIVLKDDYEAAWQYIFGELYFYEGKAEFMRSALRSIQPAQTPAKEDEEQKPQRKSEPEKIALISNELDKNPNATSPAISKATGIDESAVRQLWIPIKKFLRDGNIRRGSKSEGKTETVDTSASCCSCQVPLSTSFDCPLCNEIISGECKTCHYTNSHPDDAIP